MVAKKHPQDSTPNPEPERKLTVRDRKILRHIKAHRMKTVEVLHRKFFEGKSLDAVKSCLRRLYPLFVRSEPLDGHRVYYRLTALGAKCADGGKEDARRLGRQAKLERYAILWFLNLESATPRSLLNPRNYPEQFPVQGHRLPRLNFFVEDPPRIGFMLIDHGAHPRRLMQKAARKLERFLRLGWFDEYIRSRLFSLVILTPSDRSKQHLSRHLARYLLQVLHARLEPFQTGKGDLPIDIRAELVPGLDSLLFSKPNRRGK